MLATSLIISNSENSVNKNIVLIKNVCIYLRELLFEKLGAFTKKYVC